MPHWLLKAAAQGTLARAPLGDRLGRTARVHVTRSLGLGPQVFARKLQQARDHVRLARGARANRPYPSHALELGTGWYPIVPIGLWLSGVDRVTTVDLHPLLEPGRVRRCVQLYAEAAGNGILDDLMPGAWAERVAHMRDVAAWASEDDPESILKELGVDVVVGDARQTDLPAHGVDLLVSNNVLEHVPPDDLVELLRAFRRYAAPGAVMSHFVDMADHFAYFDHKLSQYHYLRFSDRTWSLVNAGLQYQNRLRISDYRALLREAGWDVVREEHGQALPADLDRIELAPRFQTYPREDLLVLRAWLVSMPTVAVLPAAAGTAVPAVAA